MSKKEKERTLVFTAYGKELMYEAYSISKLVLDLEHIPINPFLNFGYNLGDSIGFTHLVRNANNGLVARCDELWVFSKEEGKILADGVEREIGIARSAGKKIKYWVRDGASWKNYAHEEAKTMAFEEEMGDRILHYTKLQEQCKEDGDLCGHRIYYYKLEELKWVFKMLKGKSP